MQIRIMILGRSQNEAESSTRELIGRLLSASNSNEKSSMRSHAVPNSGEVDEVKKVSHVDREPIDSVDPLMQFNLFGDAEMTFVTLNSMPVSSHVSRPLSFYLWTSSALDREKFVKAAISGTRVLQEAQIYQNLALNNPIAPDINYGWVQPKRRCRPGKSARASKKNKHKRLRKEEKDRQERIRNQRHFRKRIDPARFR